MREAFGYLATTIAARQVLAGTYQFPPDFDEATKELCVACAAIRLGVPANSVDTKIKREEWMERWLKAREKTSSSESGLHFGHYKAGAQSPIISHLHALKASLAMRKGIALNRWSRGLSVMLEKMYGCTLVSKLRAILLMEADFNFTNKVVFGVRMMDNVRKHGYMPEEIYSEQGKTADDGTLAKVLFYDIVRQSRLSAGLASIDAANCYDSIAHAIASLVFQAFGVPEGAVESMLTAIQEMKYFLRTAYGDSTDFVGSSIEVKFQGLCQGNGAAPAGWAVISITILHAHKEKGHGGHFVCPISDLSGHLAAILYVDDTDILHLDMHQDQTVWEAHEALQSSVTNWGKLLLATGGAFKPAKCFYHLIAFKWRGDGTWDYQDSTQNEELDIFVPMPDGSTAPIEHLGLDEGKKTLGVITCPSGKLRPRRANEKEPNNQIDAMQDKAQEWVDRAKEGSLRRRDVWFLMDHQLWPKLGYGLCSLTAPWRDLDGCLKGKWHQIVPLGGVIRSAPARIRDTAIGFYGAGCPHVGVECLVAQINKLIMHYGCASNNGLKLKISLEYMITELGITIQPLRASYKKYGDWVTWSWLKSLWEKCDMFQIKIDFHDVPLKMPRQGDQWLMRLFEDAGFSPQDLKRLNRVRVHQQVLFLSDVLGACGKNLDQHYLERRPDNEAWSTLKFSKERPPRKDFRLWAMALNQLIPPAGIQDRLGRFLHRGYKVWSWRLDPSRQRLYHFSPGATQVYRPAAGQSTRAGTRWTRVEGEEGPVEPSGRVCTTSRDRQGRLIVHSSAEAPRPAPQPNTIQDVLLDWGHTWLWDSLVLIGDDDWLVEAIAEGTCMAVTDGSYIKELYPNMCSAAFILECRQGRGRIFGSFAEQSSVACAYRGELMGLMAIHLIFLAANKLRPSLEGHADVYSDCLGALGRVADLPPGRIPVGAATLTS